MRGVSTRSAADVLAELDVDAAAGLDPAAAERRLADNGPNLLRRKERRSACAIALAQFRSLIVLLLLIAALAALAFGQLVEGIAIAAALVINAVIGFVTEYRATRSMEALQQMARTTARVIRGGEPVEIDAAGLVPGDIVLLAEGEMVPADLRLVEVEGLQCNEAALTGESVPVGKSADPLDDDEAPLAERRNMAFSGTAVTRGAGVGVVVATGAATEVGRISAMVEGAEEEATPLERRLERLGQRLIYVVLVVGVIVALAGIAAGKDLFLMVETAIILAIAAVPEGLPIVATVALGQGMWRMARRNAVVRELSAVETLGATTVICTDKTGTLTENRMVLRQIALAGGDAEVDRHDDGADFRRRGRTVDPEADTALHDALRAGVLCANAELDAGDGEGSSGDPTELALLEAGAWAGLGRPALLEAFPEEREVSFDPETKMMATIHRADNDERLVAVKGAPEAVLPVCTRVRIDGGDVRDLDDAEREDWLGRNLAMAADGLRVLAVAERRTEDGVGDDPYRDLTLLGLVGLYDPPREAVRGAIAACRDAGIRVVMVTGDQPATAANIAHAIGIVDAADAPVLGGRDLGDVAAADCRRRDEIRRTPVFARVSPEQKLALVRLYQEAGDIVGMTGDGVNDAPALKKADIGIAMGRRGTEVARETADVVLRDDAFATIVMAIEQGRTIFGNIRKFVIFLLSGNLGQIVTVAAAALANAPLPLLPLQILFLNLVLDVFPALAIGVSRSETDIMRRPPRDPQEPILTRASWLAIGGFGGLIAASVLGAFAYAFTVLDADRTTAVTIAFLSYGFARLWHAFNMRSPGTAALDNSIVRNPFVWAALALCAGLLLAAVHVPPLAALLQIGPLPPAGWAVVLLASLTPLVLGQLALAIAGARREAA